MRKINWQGNQHVQSFKKKAAKVMFIFGLFAVLGFTSYGVRQFFPKTVYAEKEMPPQDISDEVLNAKIEIMKLNVVNDVSSCENEKQDEGLIVYDPDHTEIDSHIPSIGLMMFKTKTVQYYEKKLYGIVMSNKDANQLALDGTKSKALAEDVMFKTSSKASGDWKICAARKNADVRIDLINQLSK